jgi:hypothetical protein
MENTIYDIKKEAMRMNNGSLDTNINNIGSDIAKINAKLVSIGTSISKMEQQHVY